MMVGLVMELLRYFSSIDDHCPGNCVIFARVTGWAIVSTLAVEKESLDSEEQCTGEKPGLVKTRTESATENNYPSQDGQR
jgi:hypothetical protein